MTEARAIATPTEPTINSPPRVLQRLIGGRNSLGTSLILSQISGGALTDRA
nr:hypothetical protein [Coleofasciculus sp. LEGE 07092]